VTVEAVHPATPGQSVEAVEAVVGVEDRLMLPLVHYRSQLRFRHPPLCCLLELSCLLSEVGPTSRFVLLLLCARIKSGHGSMSY
jgi:hypothetical protein